MKTSLPPMLLKPWLRLLAPSALLAALGAMALPAQAAGEAALLVLPATPAPASAEPGASILPSALVPSTQPLAQPIAPLAEPEAPAQATPALPRSGFTERDIGAMTALTDLWERLRAGFAMPDLDEPVVRQSEQFYAGKPEYMRRMAERSRKYMFHILEEVEKRGMPSELALLPFVESAFNPQAVSVAKASGMWQFIPSTGRSFALKQNTFRDDRRDVLASTRAALDYLTVLYGMFNDWHLALAAYNWGEGSVKRAIERNQRLGLPTDYLSLKMPNETRHYVPKLQALKNIVAQPQTFAVNLPEMPNHPYFTSVPIERDIDVTLAAKLAEVSQEEFHQLNPQLNKPVILAAGTEQILLPYDNAEIFRENLHKHLGTLSSWTAWVAPATLKPAEAARRTGMSEARLREVNQIPQRMLIKAGSTLLVSRAAHQQEDVSSHLADNGTMALAYDGPAPRLKGRTAKGGKLAKAGKGRALRVASAGGVRGKASTGKAGKPANAKRGVKVAQR